ncbi:MAG: hypothetical protein ACM3N4_02760 [Nitrososphaerota archaeon]
MREVLQPISAPSRFGRANGPSRPADSWKTSWSREAAPLVSAAATTWWTATDEGFILLQRMALAHLLVGICVAVALGWQSWIAPAAPGVVLTPAIGLIVALGGMLALLFSRLDRPALLLSARLALVAVDLSAAGGILWMRGGEGWALLLLLPAVALAIAFFAERGGVLATILAALLIVTINCSRHVAVLGWMPSLLVFLGTVALVVAFLSIYSARMTETSLNLRWLLSDARAANERLHADQHKLATRLRSAELAQEPLLYERAHLGDVAEELALLVNRVAQGDSSAAQTLQTLRPDTYGPLAGLASALVRLSRATGASWSQPWSHSGLTATTTITALDGPVRAQGEAIESLDRLAHALCVNANEMVTEAQALEPGVRLIGSGHYTQALWQLEQHLRTQATYSAMLGTQLADIRRSQEHLRTVLGRTGTGAKTPVIFATSDIRPLSLSAGAYSGPLVALGPSATGSAHEVSSPQVTLETHPGDGGTVRRGNWPK